MKVSIITAAYNCGPYLKACLESVRSQKFDDYEHLILNDHSTDNGPKILKRYAAKDKHIRLIKPPQRLKCGSAYSRLGEEASGDIVGVLDADDALASKAILRLVRLYDKYPGVDYIWSQFWLCDDKLHKLKRGFSSHPGKRSLLEAGIAGKHCFSHWRTFRRKLLEKGKVFPLGLKSAVDKYMGYFLEELGVGGFADLTLYKYRQRIGGLSFTGRKNWKIMKREFAERRKERNIKVYPIKRLELK